MSGLRLWLGLACVLVATACDGVTSDAPPVGEARFEWFEYSGADPLADGREPGLGDYRNPILSGFYPDPGITQVGGDYYIVTSTFAYYPGIPVFHSRDLVSWTQLGNAIDRPGMLDFGKLGMSRGVFAPTITHHDGVFYIANTCVDCGGNFIITARDPAGPWSDPVWLPQVGGIDPSLFFDTDGAVYLMNNDAPPEPPLYDGHRAIWMRAIDPKTFQSISEPVVLINGGVRREDKPIWIEGPSIYRHDGWYYLSAAEGGTAEGHSQVILRSRNVLGPYEPGPANPILTQRHLPPDRPDPITSVGHAAFVTTPDGAWWTSFLGTRPYAHEPDGSGFYNTGRETFLMPVRWKDGWPVMTSGDELVPHIAPRPALPQQAAPTIPTTGAFTLREDFDAPKLPPHWMALRGPEGWPALGNGALTLRATPDGLGDFGRPAFIGRRQQHINATATTELVFNPASGEEAGLAAFQNDEFWYTLGVASENGKRTISVRRRAGPDSPTAGEVLASQPLAGDGPVFLRITATADGYSFLHAETEDDWRTLLANADGRILSTRTAGGFIGVTFGPYAQTKVDGSANTARSN